MSRAVTQKRPNFHFSESLSPTLRLSAKWLLCDERVRTNGAHMNLILHHMMKLHNIHIPDRYRLIERFSGAPVFERYFPVFRKTRLLQLFFYFRVGGSRKRRHDGLITERMRGKTEMQFKNLTQIHARRHAKRSQNHVYRSAVWHKRHILLRQNL